MTNQDNKSDTKTGSRKFSKGGRDRSSKGTNGKPGQKSSKSLNSDEAVPMLKYGPFNNFITFKERIKTACMEKYGDLARLIELEEYWEPDAIDRETDYPNARSDDIEKAALIHAMKERATVIAKMKANRASMYAYIVSKLSKESLDELKRHEDYAEIDERVDPLLLWKTIKELHMVATSSKVSQVVKRKAREDYQSCKQGAFESLVDFKARFDSRYDAYKDQGNVELSEEDVAMDFLESLDRARYSDFIVETINDIAKGVMNPPSDVNQVYVLANTRLVVKKNNSNYNVGASYATVEASRPTKGKRGKGGAGKKGGNKNGGKLSSSDDNKDDSSDKNKNKEEKQKRRLENVECYNCGRKGHFARDCPANEDDASEGEELSGATLCDDECLAANSVAGGNTVKYYEVILDSGSQINIVHPRFLRDVREGHGGCKGLFGERTNLTKVGTLEGFFECLSSSGTRVSVLSQADVEDLYDVTYEPGKSYTVHMPDRDVTFMRRNKLYVADFSEWIDDDYEECNAVLSLMTLEEREHLYTRKEVKRALKAEEFIKNAGYPSQAEAVSMVRDGNINNMPVNVGDVNTYYDIYGPVVEAVRGKSTKRKVSFVHGDVDEGIREQRRVQTLVSDIMHLNKRIFLISVSSPLELTISSALTSQSAPSLGQALQVQINLLRSRGFDTNLVIVDPQKSLMALEGSFPGVEINGTGAGDHLAKVDAKIRRIKETARSILVGLPYTLPQNRAKDLVTYVVNRLNTRRTSALNDNVCPRSKFTGRKIDYKREFMLGFGDYVEAYDPKARSNTMDARTEPCIALYPAANISGSWIFWNLKTDSYVRRTHWVKMRTTRNIVSRMNTLAGVDVVGVADEMVREPTTDDRRSSSAETVTPAVEPSVPTLTVEEAAVERDQQDGGEYDEDVPPSGNGNVPEEVPPPPRRSGRERTERREPGFEYSLTQMSVKKGLAKHGEAAKVAVAKEFKQLFKEKKVLKPTMWWKLSKSDRRKVIRSSMFLKEKYDAFGVFEKLKGRLVADGRMQDKMMYQERRSPTARNESMIMELCVAVLKKKRKAKVDITGAYLNAFVDRGDKIFMELSRDLTSILVDVFPWLKPYVDPQTGKLLVQILKALYGLVQSAALWFEALTAFLKSLGFVPNTIDDCVLNKRNDGRDITIILYVDDILMLSENQSDIDWLIAALTKEYGELTVESGDSFTYLGMGLETARDGSIRLRMDAYVQGVLDAFQKEYPRVKTSTIPASTNLFKPGNGKLLSPKDKSLFHTFVAKLLYLSKRTRPDIQLAVLYLCTRVREPTKEDFAKLLKLLGYLKLTKHKARVITNSGNMRRIVAYVDASFASHADGKGHTGLVLKWGDTTIMTTSRKQKIATKDSTEAELVGLSDSLVEVERANEYLKEQGIELDVPVIYQDNMSTIALVESETSGNVRTRHLSARRAIVYEAARVRKSVRIMFLRTIHMVADVLTKPLGGRLFYKFAEALLGKDTANE